jgi:hypothetical protein
MAIGPLPQPDPVTQPYWDSLKAHAMQVQRCAECGKWVFYPRALCPHCGGARLEWRPVSGRATLYSFTIVHRAPSPELQAEAPYVVALVDLEEGVRLMARLTGIDPDPANLRIGLSLRLHYDDATAEVTLPVFRPSGTRG